jgi:hypothetical protein
MATADEIAALRLLIAEPNNVDPWTDAVLGEIIDAVDNDLDAAAYQSWITKAASYASLVDVTESGSSRKLSQLQEQALRMATKFQSGGVDPGGDNLTGMAYTLPIVRT